MRIAANLFAAGQETTVRLLGTALQLIGERPELQQLLRDERDRIPNFVEETLRIESPIKGDFRLSPRPDDRRRRRHPRRHDGDGAQRRGEPRPAPVRAPGRVRRRPRERAPAHRVRARHPHLPGRAARARRGAREHRAPARPHGRHPDLGGRARPGRRPPLRVRADVHPARPAQPAPRVRSRGHAR